MIDDMIAGIAKRLREALPCRIYKNPVPQGLERPCFLINPILFTRVQQLGARERRIYSFDVVYLPKTEERSEIYRVMNVLMRALRIIDTDFAGKLLGRDMECEIIDGVLHFRVRYDFSVCQKQSTDDPMEILDVKGELKHE